MTVAELIKKYNIKKVYTPLFGYVSVKVRNGDYPIYAEADVYNGLNTFTKDGTVSKGKGECLIFLDDSHTPITEENCEKMYGKKHKEFRPFEKVLALCCGVWRADFYSYYNDNTKYHETIGNCAPDDDEIVPYEGHEDWLGKTWEECHE